MRRNGIKEEWKFSFVLNYECNFESHPVQVGFPCPLGLGCVVHVYQHINVSPYVSSLIQIQELFCVLPSYLFEFWLAVSYNYKARPELLPIISWK